MVETVQIMSYEVFHWKTKNMQAWTNNGNLFDKKEIKFTEGSLTFNTVSRTQTEIKKWEYEKAPNDYLQNLIPFPCSKHNSTYTWTYFSRWIPKIFFWILFTNPKENQQYKIQSGDRKNTSNGYILRKIQAKYGKPVEHFVHNSCSSENKNRLLRK